MDSGVASTKAAQKKRAELALRTQHVNYLEYVAERDDVTIGQAFEIVLDAFRQTAKTRPKPANKRAEKQLRLTAEHYAFLLRLSVDWGVGQSEVARRLIDGAIQQDSDING